MENRGGKRHQAGRKRSSNANSFVSKMEKALLKKAKETGKSLQTVIVDAAYNEEMPPHVRKDIFKIIVELMHVKPEDETEKVPGCIVMLPGESESESEFITVGNDTTQSRATN